MDNSVNKDLSLFLIIDIIPITKPITPNPAINGVGNGSRIILAKAENFKAINRIKSNVNIAAHFPLFDFDQS